MKTLVTGGAGFIGSHLVDYLMKSDNEVVVLDNLSTGRVSNIESWTDNPRFTFVKGDLLKKGLIDNLIQDCDVVFHLSANLESRMGKLSPQVCYDNNIQATFNLLEAMRSSINCKKVIFTSSCTVYGDASVLPTPETYNPNPISIYGASKLACEVLVRSYVNSYDISARVFRVCNVVGPRLRHGVIYDFINKLRTNPDALEILGDGTQKKSYIYIKDCINALTFKFEKFADRYSLYNLASTDNTDVKTVAYIVTEEMKLKDHKFDYVHKTSDGRGWNGDVKYTQLSIENLISIGWSPLYNSEESVRLTTRDLLKEEGGFN